MVCSGEWLIFRHPALDFASSHFYEEGTIDDPRDTVAPAVSTGRLVREALSQVTDGRPFFDSECGRLAGAAADGGLTTTVPPVDRDLAIAIRRC